MMVTMGKSLEEMREESEKLSILVTEKDLETYTYDPEVELNEALVLLQDCANLFTDILDPKRKGRVTKFLKQNIETLSQELQVYMSALEDGEEETEESERAEKDEQSSDWEVAFLKDLADARPITQPKQGFRACHLCDEWTDSWQKFGKLVRCAECIKKSSNATTCSVCGDLTKTPKFIGKSPKKVCNNCYNNFEESK